MTTDRRKFIKRAAYGIAGLTLPTSLLSCSGVPDDRTTSTSHNETEKNMASIASVPNTQLWNDWLALWNGDLARAERIVAANYVLHMAPLDGGDLSRFAGPAGLAGWIGGLHAVFKPFRFAVEVEPLFDRDMIAGRWIATGAYAGGFPGATADVGSPIRFSGADFLRIADGKVAEYWLSSDLTVLMSQLGMLR